MGEGKLYAGVKGLVVDVPLVDGDDNDVPSTSVESCRLFVKFPKATEEVEWPATPAAPNFLRHVVPADTELEAGVYKIQPHIHTTSGFDGRCETVELELFKHFK